MHVTINQLSEFLQNGLIESVSIQAVTGGKYSVTGKIKRVAGLGLMPFVVVSTRGTLRIWVSLDRLVLQMKENWPSLAEAVLKVVPIPQEELIRKGPP